MVLKKLSIASLLLVVGFVSVRANQNPLEQDAPHVSCGDGAVRARIEQAAYNFFSDEEVEKGAAALLEGCPVASVHLSEEHRRDFTQKLKNVLGEMCLNKLRSSRPCAARMAVISIRVNAPSHPSCNSDGAAEKGVEGEGAK